MIHTRKERSSETIRAFCTENFYKKQTMLHRRKERSSETIRAFCTENFSNVNTLFLNRYKDANNFNSLLAGLIDSNGCFLLSKAGYTSCEITVGEKDKILLSIIQKNIGGFIEKGTGEKVWRWRLHDRPGMINLLSRVDTKLQLKKRCEQFEKVAKAISFKSPHPSLPSGKDREQNAILVVGFGILPLPQSKPLKNRRFFTAPSAKENAWLSGFFEGERYLYFNKPTLQLSITPTQKDKTVREKIAKEMGGSIDDDKS